MKRKPRPVEDIERDLLAAFFGDPDTWFEGSFLDPDDFLLGSHRAIYRAMQAIRERGEEPTEHSVFDQMCRRGPSGVTIADQVELGRNSATTAGAE